MNRYGIPKDDAKELKKNVDNSSSGGGGSSNVEYYATDVEKLQLLGEYMTSIIGVFSLFKYTYAGYGGIEIKCIFGGLQYYIDENDKNDIRIYAVAFSKIKKNQMEANTLKDLLISLNIDISLFNSVFTPITEEEFYDLNK